MATMGFAIAKGNPNIRDFPEHGTAGSFVAGDLVDLNGGKVRIAASDQKVMGVAQKAASGTEDTLIPIAQISSEQEWMCQVDATSAETNKGEDYGLNIGTAGSMSVDLGDTTTCSVNVLKLHARDGALATGRVYVSFRDAVIQHKQ